MKLRLFSLCLSTALLTSCSQEKLLDSSPAPSVSQQPERLFLQQITSHSAIIKWRGDNEKACIINKAQDATCYESTVTAGNHREAFINGLQADTTYTYFLENAAGQHTFTTAPKTGLSPADGKIRVWVLGDSGTASELNRQGEPAHPGEAKAVMDGFVAYNDAQADSSLDMILLLGDNAYLEGTDSQWQTSVFDLYRPLLSRAALWPTIGNHEMGLGTIVAPGHGEVTMGGLSTSPDPDSFVSHENSTPIVTPYLNIFTLPAKGEAGGVASGTEQYYSFDYGNLHVVSLDSQLTARDELQRQTMKDWLIADLSSNNSDWTIVIFHHPPYTKGSHDSDTAIASRLGIDQPIIDMREEFTQVFEDYGVDLVYSGHSHSYERSWYLNGHRGDANTFSAAEHTEINSDGIPVTGRDGQGYFQISPGSGIDDKVVYTVAGSAGKVSLHDGKLDHPAHAIQPDDSQQRHGLAELGSVLVEATGTKLSAVFINDKGEPRDKITIER